MNIFQRLAEQNRRKKEERENKCNDLLSKILAANTEAEANIKTDDFTDPEFSDYWKNKYQVLYGDADEAEIKKVKKAKAFSTLKKEADNFFSNYTSLEKRVFIHNNYIAEQRIDKAYSLIGEVEGRKLDNQQMKCIVMESHNNLIIAGAGTGKTTTVVGKIKYLLKSGKCLPEDILVLSFTNASATEMSERINKETGCNISASTFHKLGLNIISKADGIIPKISKINLRSFVKEHLEVLMKKPEYFRALNNYLLYNKVSSKSEFDFTKKSEYDEYLRMNPPVTFVGEPVKSYGEMDIANFFYQNGIPYEYEAKYKFDTRDAEYAQYYPDFYLPESDIYIEYFGINKDGEVPEWFSGKNGKCASETYRESMEWKFNLHKKNNTIMIPCYSYEKSEGNLLQLLEEKLKKHNVKFSPKSPEEIWDIISKENKSVLDGIIELFETTINLIKSNGYTLEQFASMAKTGQHIAFINLLRPLFEAYVYQLKKDDEIDFNDMINNAAEYVRTGKYRNNFSYVIVDEYQDISKARYRLLAEMRKSHDFELFCVGDDWQSIYRFAGSDINYILSFAKYWGRTTVNRIETTYRFTDSLIKISGFFITRNPSQIVKNITGNNKDPRFSLGEITGYNEKYAVDFLAEKIEDLPEKSSVFFIGRYSFDVDILDNCTEFECRYNNITGFIDVKHKKRPDLKMIFLTAHKSKGLQADYVFIINNKNTRMGFPSKIQDDPILSLLLDNTETYPFAEERRLFYVALTRAKKKAFLLLEKDKESIFAKELHNRFQNDLRNEQYECPICGGKLVKKSGPYGVFFGCENYKITGCNYIRKIKFVSKGE